MHSRQRSRFPLKCATFLHHPGVFSGLLGFIVDAATEEAPELPKCEHCGHAEAEQPGCILICKGCSVESNDWRDASAKHKCEDCCSCHASSEQSACQQKGTLEFFQDENPPLFVDASVRYTESRLDHWFLANDRRYICVC